MASSPAATSQGSSARTPRGDVTPFSRVMRQRGRLDSGTRGRGGGGGGGGGDGGDDLNRKIWTAAAAPSMSSQAMPLVRLLWRALNEEASQHLTVDELSVLGYACMGHPPETEQTQLQVHKMRACLAYVFQEC
jgi:hypothetical protein